MVPIEPQRTHMSFDGRSEEFGAPGTEIVFCKIDARQRPDGKNSIRKGGTGDILDVFALTCTQEWQQREL